MLATFQTDLGAAEREAAAAAKCGFWTSAVARTEVVRKRGFVAAREQASFELIPAASTSSPLFVFIAAAADVADAADATDAAPRQPTDTDAAADAEERHGHRHRYRRAPCHAILRGARAAQVRHELRPGPGVRAGYGAAALRSAPRPPDGPDHVISVGVDRHSVLVALGGSAVASMCGFAASALYRGVGFISVPTTRAAQRRVGRAHEHTLVTPHGHVGSNYAPIRVILDADVIDTE